MAGLAAIKMLRNHHVPEKIELTPEMAVALLERNKMNRPLSDLHVKRIANQIKTGKWQFNGDTIKISDSSDVLDGQHRLWAVVEAKKPIETLIVYGIPKEAFSTVDTLRKPRSGGDVVALAGSPRYRNVIAGALQWLIRWQGHVLETYKAPQNRVENSDVEEAFASNPNIVNAVERAQKLRGLANPSIMAFVYYVVVNRNPELAERLMATLENPAGVGVNDPFFRLRTYFTADHHRQKEPLMTIALAFKACNAAFAEQHLKVLSWKSQGMSPEAFPKLSVK